MSYDSELIRTYIERGYVHQITNDLGLDQRATEQTIPAYIGFDCTADSLHVGSLVQIMMLRVLQRTGHKPIVLMGILQVFEKYLTFGDGPTDAIMVDNAEWLDNLAYIRFLRDFGPYFSINRMLGMESVKLRLDREQPLSFLEFNYAILQAYDFMELRRRYGCVLQMGGSDQWGNIVTGIDLTRRVDSQEVFGLTSPLITTASGAKMGKTADGAIWLNADRLSPFQFWQFWRNTEDADVERFLSLFTELPMDEVRRLGALEGADINEAKIILANEATTLCHGPDAAAEAMQTAQQTFADGGAGDGLPQISLSAEEADGLGMIAALVKVGFAKSNGEARRLIRGGGARLNDVAVNDEDHVMQGADFGDGRAKISAGKKRHALIVID